MGTDKQLVRERFEASFGRYNRLAKVQQRICVLLVQRMQQMRIGSIERALEVGAGTGFLTCGLTDEYPSAEWYINDIVPSAEKYLAKYLTSTDHTYLWGDAEQMEFPVELNLIASASTVQWFDDMEAFVRECAAATVRGGWLAITTFGKANFGEIRQTTGEGLDYIDLERLKEILVNAGYQIKLAEEYMETLYFDIPLDVLHHIKATGVNSLRKTQWTRGQIAEFNEAYQALFTSPEGGVGLTYHPIIIIAQKI